MKYVYLSAGLFLTCILSSQTIQQCQYRFSTYLNFRGQLNNSLRFNDTMFCLLKTNGECELSIYQSELDVLSAFMQGSSTKEQLQLFKQKGNKHLNRKLVDSLNKVAVKNKIQVTSKQLPLAGYSIAIDPGHFATSLKEAESEQKYLRFTKVNAVGKTDSVLLFESRLTFATARLVQKLLQQQGADVFMTRQQENCTSFNCTYGQWLLQHKKRVLDSLKNIGAHTLAKYQKLMKAKPRDFFWEFFRDFDLANRAKLINDYKPDASLIIHYNVDEKNAPWKKAGTKNYTMVFIGGAFTTSDLDKEENKMDFLRLLITPQLTLSDSLAAKTVAYFSNNLNIPIAASMDADYLAKNCNTTKFKGVYCRNLMLCRKINSVLVYGEALYQDNEKECLELMKSDKELYGIKTNARIMAAAQSYYNAVLEFLQKRN